MAERLLTAKEVSQVLRTNVNYVYALMKAGKLNYLVIGQKKVRESTLDEFIRNSEGYDVTNPENIVKIED
ncbi:MAG: helix-turn-helix domain-containing protein [Lachnospiraceae bacterium]|nr:helix-turn-helix domain-containing protein [Lachnospiraceae bacterium]